MNSNVLSIRLTICINDCPIGLRIQKEEPLPAYQHTYPDTEDGRTLALYHLKKIEDYIQRNKQIGTTKK